MQERPLCKVGIFTTGKSSSLSLGLSMRPAQAISAAIMFDYEAGNEIISLIQLSQILEHTDLECFTMLTLSYSLYWL